VALQRDVETPGVHQGACRKLAVVTTLNPHKEWIDDRHQKPPVGAVVMTTLNIQKAVVVTTLPKIYACMESGRRSCTG
jgi:hypothetical protein